MNHETMNIHKALCELKILDDRISKAISECRFVGVTKKVAQMVGSESVDAFNKRELSAYDSVQDLIARRAAIKSAVVRSNATTKVKICEKEYSVAEAIEMKNHGLDGKKRLLRYMSAALGEAESHINRTKTELEVRADNFVKDQTGSKETKGAELLEMRKNYIAMQDVELVDPLRIRDKIKALNDEINSFTAEVDSVLSTSNAMTEIIIEY